MDDKWDFLNCRQVTAPLADDIDVASQLDDECAGEEECALGAWAAKGKDGNPFGVEVHQVK